MSSFQKGKTKADRQTIGSFFSMSDLHSTKSVLIFNPKATSLGGQGLRSWLREPVPLCCFIFYHVWTQYPSYREHSNRTPSLKKGVVLVSQLSLLVVPSSWTSSFQIYKKLFFFFDSLKIIQSQEILKKMAGEMVQQVKVDGLSEVYPQDLWDRRGPTPTRCPLTSKCTGWDTCAMVCRGHKCKHI